MKRSARIRLLLVVVLPVLAALFASRGSCPPAPSRNPITFLSEIVDSAGTVDDIVKEVSVAFDRRGRPSILYVNGSFRFATRESDGWRIEDLHKESHGEHTTSLVLDASGDPWISYYVVCCLENPTVGWGHKQGGRWEFHPLSPPLMGLETRLAVAPDGTVWGAARDLDGLLRVASMREGIPREEYEESTWVGWGLAMAVDRQGNPHLVYVVAKDCDQGQVLYVTRDHSTWRREVIPGAAHLNWANLAIGAGGTAWFAFSSYPDGTLYLGKRSNGAWSVSPVSEPGTVGPVSMVLDDDGYPWLAWRDWRRQSLFCAHQEGARWQCAEVDSGIGVGEALSLALDAQGEPAIAYYDSAHGDTRLATGVRTDLALVRPRAWMAAQPASLVEGQGEAPIALTIRVANPLSGTGSFAIGTPASAHVTARVITATGRVLATPYDGRMTRGWRVLHLPSGLTSGVYFLLVSSEGERRIAKIVLVS